MNEHLDCGDRGGCSGACLHEETEHGEHGEAAVLELLHLELSEGVGVVSEAEGIEVVPTRVELVQILTGRAAVYAVALDASHEQHLQSRAGVVNLSQLRAESTMPPWSDEAER